MILQLLVALAVCTLLNIVGTYFLYKQTSADVKSLTEELELLKLELDALRGAGGRPLGPQRTMFGG